MIDVEEMRPRIGSRGGRGGGYPMRPLGGAGSRTHAPGQRAAFPSRPGSGRPSTGSRGSGQAGREATEVSGDPAAQLAFRRARRGSQRPTSAA